jgi:hypothetical protein
MAGFVTPTKCKEIRRGIDHASRAEARLRFLNLRRLPDLAELEEAGFLLGLNTEEVNLLIRYGLLRAVGDPKPNGKKRLSTAEVLEVGSDREWLDRAVTTIIAHWLSKNEQTSRKAQTSGARQQKAGVA